MEEAQYRLGADIGGTFTDIVLIDNDGGIYSKKVLSTPDDYSQGIETGVAALLNELSLPPGNITEFAHATTVATNTIIERKGVKAALITTKGFRDVLELGRYRTPRLYDIHFRKPEPLVERRLRFELDERTASDGNILKSVDNAELAALVKTLRQHNVQAIAIAFINSYANPENERHVAQYLAEHMPEVTLSVSTKLLPQIGEYERTSTTVVNAYIRPVVQTYVESLQKRLHALQIRAPLGIMQSSGGMAPGSLIAQRPIYIIESGPAAGVLGSQRVARHGNIGDLIVFDMGGTTAKATIIVNNQYTLCPETEVGGGAALGQRMVKGGGFPVQVPTIDIAEVGAGGGSIAAIDDAGGIRVGPRSAGASPGPICYNRGGTDPTVTDANLVLGYLNPSALVGGELSLNYDLAKQALEDLGKQLGVSTVDAAYGIHLIANATMLRALSGVSSEKGMDPSDFSLFAIGGNGPVHAATLAESAGMTRITVPPVAGLFSALGLLFADVEHQFVNAFFRKLENTTVELLQDIVNSLVDEGTALLFSEGFTDSTQRHIEIHADIKYTGQSSSLPIELPSLQVDTQVLTALSERFSDAHYKTFGYVSPAEQLQFVSIKALCRGLPLRPRMPEKIRRSNEKTIHSQSRKVYFGPEAGWAEVPVLTRSKLASASIVGPAIIEEYDTTTVVRPGWKARCDDFNNIVLERQPEKSI